MKKYFFLLAFPLLLLSCEKKNPPVPEPEPSPAHVSKDPVSPPQNKELHEYTNKWIAGNMYNYYYWNDRLPQYVNLNLEHKAFFESLLYKGQDGDRFSIIKENYVDLMNALSGISKKDIGFEIIRVTDKEKTIGFIILYVKKGSTAEMAGLKRGDLIRKIDGVNIDESNYKTILRNKDKLELTYWRENKEMISPSFNTMSDFAEHPILFSKNIQPEGTNLNVAYLVYNFFSPDKGDSSHAYDLALIEEFEKFSAQGVNEFILDLRYNGGGAVSSCRLLSSLLRKERKESDLFSITKTNKKIDEEHKEYFIEKFNPKKQDPDNKDSLIPALPSPIALPSININRVFVLTGSGTASASEMVINALRPYMEVIQIGATTVGKNVGSIPIKDEKNRENKCGLLPIVFKIFNAANKSDYSTGFVPSEKNKINEFEHRIVDFDDFDDPLRKQALKIMGVTKFPGKNNRQKNIPKQRMYKVIEPKVKKPFGNNEQWNELDYPMYMDRHAF